MWLGLLLFLPSASAALTGEQKTTVRSWLYGEGVACGIARARAQTTWDLACPSLPFNLPANLCVTRLGAECVPADADGDGVDAAAGDCDDADPTVFPGAVEVCDGLDQDCDGAADEGLACPDRWLVGEHSLAEAQLSLSGAVAAGELGAACALGDLDGDGVAELVVGARGAATVYVFDGPLAAGSVGDVADADATLLGAAGSAFGWSLDAPADLDADGLLDLLVGAPYALSSRGAAYRFGAPRGEVPAGAALGTWRGDSTNDQLGVHVGTAGDQDGDGLDEVLVGAWMDDTSGSNAGSTYVFGGAATGTVSPGAAWATLTGESAADWSGYAAAGGEDLDGDGWDDLLVGADGWDGGGTQSGAAWLLTGPVSGTVPLATAAQRVGGEAAYSYVGHAVASPGDLDGDGRPEWAVGGFGDDEAGRDAGAAWIFGGVSPGAGPVSAGAALRPGGALGGFGYWLRGGGDVDGDGLGELIVGAPLDDSGGADAGAVWLLYGPLGADSSGGPSLSSDAARLSGLSAGDAAGYQAAGAGDLDGDGLDDVAVGARGADAGATDGGAVHVFLSGG